MNNFQKTIVGILVIGGLVMVTLAIMDIRAEVVVEQDLVEMRRIINEAKK